MLFFYNGSEADGRRNFKAFFDLSKSSSDMLDSTHLTGLTSEPVADFTKEQPYEVLNSIQVSSLTRDAPPFSNSFLQFIE